MILVYSAVVVMGLEALVLRSRVRGLANLRIRRLWLVWVALADQVLVISILPGREHALLTLANFVSYGLGGAFLWANRHIAGTWLIAAGAGLNVLVLALNHGIMPASRTALAISGWRPPAGHFQNSSFLAHARLPFLGDVLAVPRWMPGHDVFSVGDFLVVVGVCWVLWRNSVHPVSDQSASVPPAAVLSGAAQPPSPSS